MLTTSNTCASCGARDSAHPMCNDARSGRIKVHRCPSYAPMTLSQAMRYALDSGDRKAKPNPPDPIRFDALKAYGTWHRAVWLPDECIWPYFSRFRPPTRTYPSGYIRAAETRKFAKWLYENRPDIYMICRLGVYANPKYFSIGVNENENK